MKKALYSTIPLIIYLLLISSCKEDNPQDSLSTGSYSLGTATEWKLASTPLRFPEALLSNDPAFGFNRANISWYTIDASVFHDKSGPLRPANITSEDMSKDECRVVWVNEIFPGYESPNGIPLNIPSLSIDYYPSERGRWNYDTEPTIYSSGINTNGELNTPGNRWGGIMRKLEKMDYPVNYIDFWLMDPFTTTPDADGLLVFDIGQISEDILADRLLSAEYTEAGAATETVWGKVLPLSDLNSFNNIDPAAQDIGLDGLKTEDEKTYFNSYLQKIEQKCQSEFYHSILSDPTGDNYHHYLGADYDALNYNVRDRYKYYCGEEQNSSNSDDLQISTRQPNSEDLNHNGRLDTLNSYFEYKVEINHGEFQAGQNFIVESYRDPLGTIKKENGANAMTIFYHFRIPLKEYTAQYGSPAFSANPQFIRIYVTGFQQPVNLRIFNLCLTEDITN
ncbi:MAG: cell surface protein SprA [Bacteroidales bacterium]|nr:cell surface protein SprA [Bacteroidales bacterium]